MKSVKYNLLYVLFLGLYETIPKPYLGNLNTIMTNTSVLMLIVPFDQIPTILQQLTQATFVLWNMFAYVNDVYGTKEHALNLVVMLAGKEKPETSNFNDFKKVFDGFQTTNNSTFVMKDVVDKTNDKSQLATLSWCYFLSLFNNNESLEKYLVIDASPKLCSQLFESCLISGFPYLNINSIYSSCFPKTDQPSLKEKSDLSMYKVLQHRTKEERWSNWKLQNEEIDPYIPSRKIKQLEKPAVHVPLSSPLDSLPSIRKSEMTKENDVDDSSSEENEKSNDNVEPADVNKKRKSSEAEPQDAVLNTKKQKLSLSPNKDAPIEVQKNSQDAIEELRKMEKQIFNPAKMIDNSEDGDATTNNDTSTSVNIDVIIEENPT